MCNIHVEVRWNFKNRRLHNPDFQHSIFRNKFSSILWTYIFTTNYIVSVARDHSYLVCWRQLWRAIDSAKMLSNIKKAFFNAFFLVIRQKLENEKSLFIKTKNQLTEKDWFFAFPHSQTALLVKVDFWKQICAM